MTMKHYSVYVILFAILVCCQSFQYCHALINSTTIIVWKNIVEVNQSYRSVDYDFKNIGTELADEFWVNISGSNVFEESLRFLLIREDATKISKPVYIMLNDTYINKTVIEFSNNFPLNSRIVVNNTYADATMYSAIMLTNCNLRNNVTFSILNTHVYGSPVTNYLEAVYASGEFDIYLNSALIIQHLVAVNVSDAFVGNSNINHYSMLVLDDVNCYNCSGSIFVGSNITATNGSLLRVSKAVFMHSNGSIHSSLFNFYGNNQVVNGSLFDFRDCFSSQHFMNYYKTNISVINNSAVSMTRISSMEGVANYNLMFPTNVDKSSYVHAQQCSLGTSKLNTYPLLWKALMNVDGIVDESTGFFENTKVCAYAECIRANSNTKDSTDHCKCQCTRPGLYLPQCSAINDSVQSIIDDVTDNTNQEFCALSDASNNKICRVCNTGYVPTVTEYNKCNEFTSKGECKWPVLCVKETHADGAFVKSSILTKFTFMCLLCVLILTVTIES